MNKALQKAVRIPRLELLHWTHESGLGRAQEGDLLLAIPPAGGHLSPWQLTVPKWLWWSWGVAQQGWGEAQQDQSCLPPKKWPG